VKVLVVDDSKAMRMIVLRTLRQSGVQVSETFEAVDGVDALEKVAAHTPDVVLSDWNMPNMTGIELLRQLRTQGVGVPFGFVTSESTASMRSDAIEAGAAFVIAKPFTPEQLADALGSL
jgi:two-component system, chemotaxis family, chemotaxis protein CheY